MRILSIPTIKYMNKIIPKNSPKSLQHKYIYIFNKNYDILLEQIYSVSLYSTFSQFQALYKKMNSSLSDNYIKKKSSQMLKELKELKFIEVDYINNNKYFYLKKQQLQSLLMTIIKFLELIIKKICRTIDFLYP